MDIAACWMLSSKSFDNDIYAKTIDQETLFGLIDEQIEDLILISPISTLLDGTVALPGLRFSADTNTGIYRPAANELAISCGAVQSANFLQDGVYLRDHYSTCSDTITADGATDNYTALNAIFTSSADRYKHVVLPRGTIRYVLPPPSVSIITVADKVIEGHGDATIIQIVCSNITSASYIWDINDVVFRNLRIEIVLGSGTTGLITYMFGIGDNCIFEDVTADGGLTYSGGAVTNDEFCHFGYFKDACTLYRMHNCHIAHFRSVAFKGNANSASLSNVFISGCKFEDNLIWDYLFNCPNSSGANINVTDNIFLRTNNDDALADHSMTFVNCSGCTCTGNVFRGYYDINGALHSEQNSTDITISCNDFISAGAGITMIANNVSAAQFYPVTDVIIANNNFKVFGGGSVASYSAIGLTSVVTENVYDFIITDNLINGDYLTGVRHSGSGTLKITDNTMINCATMVNVKSGCNSTIENNIFKNCTDKAVVTAGLQCGFNTYTFSEVASYSGSEIQVRIVDNESGVDNSICIAGWQIQVEFTYVAGSGAYRIPVTPPLFLFPRSRSPLKMRFMVNMYQSISGSDTKIIDAILTYSGGWSVASSSLDLAGTGNFIPGGTPFVIANNLLYFQTTTAYVSGEGHFTITYLPDTPLQLIENNIATNANSLQLLFQDPVNQINTLSAPIGLEDGALGTPALRFNDDANLGLYRLGADQLGIAGGIYLNTYTGNNDGSYDGNLSLASKDDTDSGINFISGGGGELEFIAQNNRTAEFTASEFRFFQKLAIDYQSGTTSDPQLVLKRSDAAENYKVYIDSSNAVHFDQLSSADQYFEMNGGIFTVRPRSTTTTAIDFTVEIGDGASSYSNILALTESVLDLAVDMTVQDGWTITSATNSSAIEINEDLTFTANGTPTMVVLDNYISYAAPLKVPSYTVTEANALSLPVATHGYLIYVSDETGGATLAFYDGTNWRRVQDLAAIS